MAASRRDFLIGLAASTTALARPALAQGAPGKVVVVGGGFAGATAARALQRLGLSVTLVEASETFTACPLSNAVIGGLRQMSEQEFGYGALARQGITLVKGVASGVDAQARQLQLSDGTRLSYDRLVLAPGIDLNYAALPGYSAQAAEALPHAWKAGPQTTLLARQLAEMRDGGTVVMSVPANPYRCPPGPYERASLIAHFLKRHKPRSKLIILDAKDVFSKRALFEAAWKALYPGLIEWVPLSQGGQVTEVDAGSRTLITEFDRHTGDVVNVIPPQRAGAIAQAAGVADRTGWCPIDPQTFESRLVPGIHIVGDAAIMGAVPKSAFAAHGAAKVCAQAVAMLIAGGQPQEPRLLNTCYSLVAPDYGISVAGVYHPAGGIFADVAGAGGTSPQDAPASVRAAEAQYALAWFSTVTGDAFG